MRLSDKVVVITGASSGIGEELAYQFAALGNKVVLGARNLDALKAISEKISKNGGAAMAVQTDVTKRAQVERLVKKAVESYGRIDVLINNAGASHAPGTIMEVTEEQVRATMDVNFMAGVYGVWAAVPYMEKAGGGLLVFVSSIVGKRGVARSSGYCASKFAVQGLTESIRPELSVKGIRVITVCPAGVDTPFFQNNGRANRRKFRLHPVGKVARMIVSACKKEKREALLTIDSKLLHYANVFVPGWLDWAIAKNKGVYK